MKKTELMFEYPEQLVATEPLRPSRVMWVSPCDVNITALNAPEPLELQWSQFLQKIVEVKGTNDVLVINNTKVLKRRVFAGDMEILFLSEVEPCVWEVLFPAKNYKIGQIINLPNGVQCELLQKGRPQKVKILNAEIDMAKYLDQVAELPLPPYIQKIRETKTHSRHAQTQDANWYQTYWASAPGSLAAPTASLHFTNDDLQFLQKQDLKILEITLHVGLGTFLPVLTEELNDHTMHAEYVEISNEVWQQIQNAKQRGGKVWALGTTVTRALESRQLIDSQDVVSKDMIQMSQVNLQRLQFLSPPKEQSDTFQMETRLLIQPGFRFQIVDRLLTNFHQPESTLLALVSAFSRIDLVKKYYQWAIERKFRLFSYGDLSVWIK